MKSSHHSISLAIVALLALTVGCGAAQERAQAEKTANSGEPVDAESSMAGDSGIATATVEAVVTDGFESLVSQGTTGSALMLSGDADAAKNSDKSVYTRSCVTDGNNAVVTISTTMDRSFSADRPNISISREVSGSSTQTRTWSRTKDGEAAAVTCGPNKRAASIDWSGDLAGLKLQLEFERSRSHSSTMTNKKKNKSWEHSRTFSASGSRTVEWGAVDASDTDGIVREKTVSSNVNRKFNAVNKKGEKKDVEISVKTADSAPLKVKVVRDKSTKALKKKTIKSGTIVATRNADGRAEATFADVVLSFDGSECVGESGSVTTKFFAEGADAASKSLKLTLDGGVYTLTDADSGEDMGEIAEIGCDAEDFAD